VESGEEFATVKRRGLSEASFLTGSFECPRITGNRISTYTQLASSTAHDDAVAQSTTQEVDSHFERAARAVGIGFRPEQREQRVAPMERRRRSSASLHEINEEREAARLSKHRGD